MCWLCIRLCILQQPLKHSSLVSQAMDGCSKLRSDYLKFKQRRALHEKLYCCREGQTKQAKAADAVVQHSN
jgi:hypothetical protein